MKFPRQEYWSGLPFPTARDFRDAGIKPASLASPALTGGFFITSATWEARMPSKCNTHSQWEFAMTQGTKTGAV